MCLASGCSSMYVAKENHEPHGYSEIKLADGGYLVSYETYKSVSYDEVFEFVIKRSAELALYEGYDVFYILNREDEMMVELMDMPLVTTMSTQVNTIANGVSVMSSQVNIAAPGYTREIQIKKTTAQLLFMTEDVLGIKFDTANVLAQ